VPMENKEVRKETERVNNLSQLNIARSGEE
jgi:hypothetical protein